MPIISLSNGMNVILDACDHDRFKDVTWSASKQGNTHYVMSRKMVKGVLTHTLLHRAIMNPSDGELVDHVNGNGLDNRRCNLRVASKAQNAINSRLRSDNTTGFRGVCYIPRRDRYQARLYVDGKKIGSRFRKTAEDAARDYKELAMSVYGEFVRLQDGGLI